MDREALDRVRRFNRLVTQRVGALDDRYLARDRSLGASRVLWEIGEDGTDVRALRARLDLDSGYLSRILRTLEADGLVRVTPAAGDRRVRTAVLTPRGVAERRLLDERSDDLARSLLEPLSQGQRDRLAGAMDEVGRLLTASLVELVPADPATAEAQHCLRRYYAELDRRFDKGFDPGRSLPAELDQLRPPAGAFVVAELLGRPVGCGALRFHGAEPAELKRMWVDPEVRGLGVGRRLLADLERRAAEAGARSIHLETNSALVEAIALYRRAGYREVPAFNDEPYAHHWFEKQLGSAT